MLQFDVAGTVVRISDTVIDATGRQEQRRSTIRVDGTEHPSEAGNGYTIIASWKGVNVLTTFAKKNGEVVGSGRYEVSADGQTLTVSGDQQRVVFDRVGNTTTAASAGWAP